MLHVSIARSDDLANRCSRLPTGVADPAPRTKPTMIARLTTLLVVCLSCLVSFASGQTLTTNVTTFSNREYVNVRHVPFASLKA